MITLIVGSLFSSVEYQFFPYMLMAYTGVLHRIARVAETSQSQAASPQAVISNFAFGGTDRAGTIPSIGTG
jgi:hypothetical protein